MIGVLIILFACFYWLFKDHFTLQNLARHEAALRAFRDQHPLLVYVIAFAVYVGVTGLSLPGALALTLLYGWYFDFLLAVPLISFASTTGATLAFLLSRFLFRAWVEGRFGERLETFNRAWHREGAFYLFSLRLIPVFPFFVINAVMGLTPISVTTYWWVSQLGMFPATLVYVYAGSSVPSLQTLAEQGVNAAFTPAQMTQLAVAFFLLGVFPLAARWVISRVRRSRDLPTPQQTEPANAVPPSADSTKTD